MLHYEFPSKYQLWIEDHLAKIGYSLSRPKDIAKAVLKVSDHYIDDGRSSTPWQEPSTIAAYLAYFFPLNYLRNCKVINEGLKLGFFANVNQVIDYGCGPGTTARALADSNISVAKIIGLDNHQELKLYADNETQEFYLASKFKPPHKSFLLAASYVINELESIPDWFYNGDGIMILEPSTFKASHALVKWRDLLIQKGYYIWAPCLHQNECPLQESKKDWCHDRVYWQQPVWFSAIEKHLPIKNPSMTFSYLLAKKTPPPAQEGWRVIGDARTEKGKTKWQICHPGERTFVSYLHRNKNVPEIFRGDVIASDGFTIKGNEFRHQG